MALLDCETTSRVLGSRFYSGFLEELLDVRVRPKASAPLISAIIAAVASALFAGRAVAQPAVPPVSPAASAEPAPSALAPRKDEPPKSAAPIRLVPREVTTDLVWNPAWPRFRTAEFVATGLMAAAVVPFVVLPESKSPWTTYNGFDERVRNALRLGSEEGRNAARGASDFFLTVNSTFPFFIDALASAFWFRNSRDVAFQMVEIDAEVLVATVLLQRASAVLISRERPYGRNCPADPDKQNADCFSKDHFHSFFSGHTSVSFAGAGLICSHHMNLKLWGGGLPDALACVGGFAAAATTGYLRIAADNHYLSDVLLGSAIGTMTGLGLPWLLHYRYGKSLEPRRKNTKPNHVSWMVVPTPMGASLGGTF